MFCGVDVLRPRRVLAAATLQGLLILAGSISARTIYLSASGSDSHSGARPDSAWQTIEKLNTAVTSLSAGDSILLRRGDTFAGQIILSGVQGTEQSPVVVGACGSGAKPIIKGTQEITGWRTAGAGDAVWESILPEGDTASNLFCDAVELTVTRFPTYGFHEMDARIGSPGTGIRDTELGGHAADFWKGGVAVVRSTRWSYDLMTISASSGDAITFDGNTGGRNDYTEGWGYYVESVVGMVGSVGEWAFDVYTRRLRAAFPAGGVPGDHFPVEATVHAYGIHLSPTPRLCKYIRIEQLQIEHQRVAGVGGEDWQYVQIVDCDLADCGMYGIRNESPRGGDVYNTIRRCTIREVRKAGVWMHNSRHAIVEACDIRNVTLGYGISVHGGAEFVNNNRIESNYLQGIGGFGINHFGSDNIVRDNVLDTVCSRLDDCGGIYGIYTGENTSISGNIVKSGHSYAEGVPSTVYGVQGLYCDEQAHGLLLDSNTVYDCDVGMYIHNGVNNITVLKNTFYNCSKQLLKINATSDEPGNRHHDNSFTGNRFVAGRASQYSKFRWPFSAPEVGTFTENAYVNLFGPLVLARESEPDQPVNASNQSHPVFYEAFDIESWRAAGDADAIAAPFRRDYYSGGVEGDNLVTNGTFESNVTGWSVWAPSGAGSPLSLDNGWMKCDFAGTSWALFVTTGNWNLSPGVYRFRCKLKAEKAAGIRFAVTVNGGYKDLSDIIYLPTINGETTHDLFVRCLEPSASARLEFRVSQENGPWWIDSVSFVPVTEVDSIDLDITAPLLVNRTDRDSTFTLPAGRYVYLDGSDAGRTVSVKAKRSAVVFQADASSVVSRSKQPVVGRKMTSLRQALATGDNRVMVFDAAGRRVRPSLAASVHGTVARGLYICKDARGDGTSLTRIMFVE